MFRLDDQFLKDVGLDSLPPEQKQAFLEHVYGQLELTVGTRLADGLSDTQLAEFESFIDRNDASIHDWLAANAQDYRNDPVYQQIASSAGAGSDERALLAEYASLKWLSMNRPDYRSVVQATLEEIKREIIGNRDTILGQ